jgi:threonyl-tRNA synthetase
MKILSLHCDYIKFKPVKPALKGAKLDKSEEKQVEVKEPLVIMTAVEKTDESNKEILKLYLENVLDLLEKTKAKRIVLYPYAHLSPSLSNPDFAKSLMVEAEQELKKKKLEVFRAPFGYYKEFELKCKGHPLAELSRSIDNTSVFNSSVVSNTDKLIKENVSKLNMAEKTYDEKIKAKGKDSHMVLTYEGEEFEVEDYKFKKDEDNFKMLVEKEAMKKGLSGGNEPGFIKYANQFQIEWEPMSDKGHMRYGPAGTIIFDLMEMYAEDLAKSVGIPVYSVKGTNMFNLKEPAVKEHADLFGDRLYSIPVDDQKFVMRYAACHQQFAMVKDWNISYKNLPFGAWENADSYRFEQAGELLLAFRTRKMEMPDLHVFCKDFEESKVWFKKLHEKIYEEIYKLEDDYEILFNFSSKKHYEQNKEWVLSLLKEKKKNALLHFYPEGIDYYWTFNIEYMIIDELKRPREIATVQIDIGNAKRFGITYNDVDNSKKYPVILHTAITGTIGRYIFAFLDGMVRKEKQGKKPQWPYWLAPTQVRICPVSDKFNKAALKLAEKLNSNGIRADVEDRDIPLPKKVSNAESEWCPFILVLGEKEISSGKLAVRVRQTGKIENLSEQDLIGKLKQEQGNYPWKNLALPVSVAKRPIFR